MLYDILYFYNKVTYRKENVFSNFCCKPPKNFPIFIEKKNSCMSSPMQFKPVLFKSQLQAMVPI